MLPIEFLQIKVSVSDALHISTPCSPKHSARLPPSLGLAAREFGPASLELLQNVNGIGAVQVQCRVHIRTSPTNLLNHIIRVRSANDRDLRREPLLERLCNKVTIFCEPARHWRANMQRLLRIRSVRGRCEYDVAFVDGNVFLCPRRYSKLWHLLVRSLPVNSFWEVVECVPCLFCPRPRTRGPFLQTRASR